MTTNNTDTTRATLNRLVAMATELGGLDGKLGNPRYAELTSAIASTLDALAAENARLREENAKALALIERMNHHGDEIQAAIEGLKEQLVQVIRGRAPQEPAS